MGRWCSDKNLPWSAVPVEPDEVADLIASSVVEALGIEASAGHPSDDVVILSSGDEM